MHMQAVQFYKAWDAYGALSNFSCHAVTMSEGPLTDANSPQEASSPLDQREWRSVEHFYQAQKFATTSGKAAVRPASLLPADHTDCMPTESSVNLPASFVIFFTKVGTTCVACWVVHIF